MSYKISSLSEIIVNNTNVVVMQETKKDASFPDAQFLKPGYRKPYRKTIITMVRGF